ncbi:MAG TPA: ATP-binding protein [Vicinamibacterales bacterium]|nr:ATP-binding protein [Vicinamibacterales bacterium]
MSRPSLRWRLPVFILTLLAILGLAFNGLAYWEVQRTLEATAATRLRATAGELASLLATSGAARTAEDRRLAARPDVAAVLTAPPGTASWPATLKHDLIDRSTGATIWILDANRHPVLTSPPAAAAPDAADVTPGLGPLRDTAGKVTYTATSVIAGADRQPAGYFIVRRVLSSGSASNVLGRLIGDKAAVKMGNVDDSLWTDLSRVVAAPPKVGSNQMASVHEADGDHVGTRLRIAGTPWAIWVDMPHAQVMAPARALLRSMLPVAIVLVLLGALLTRVVSGKATKPIEALVTAAEGIAGGDYSRRTRAAEYEETDRLANAFNLMAARVQEAHGTLEDQVRLRTRELAEAVKTLEETQAELVRRERLAILGQLASGVGHELRNPLGVMTNAIYYLEIVQTDASDDVREYLGMLKHQIALSEKIVTDLLDFARIKPPQVQAVPVARIVEDQIARLGDVESVRIERALPPSLPVVAVDPVQIGQVLLNVLTNAVQATTGEGIVRVTARQDGEFVVIEVHDSGPGVPPDLRERIFEPLFTTKPRGIGLGLAVSRGLAEANGGHLALADGAGPGAVFAVTLPCAMGAGA